MDKTRQWILLTAVAVVGVMAAGWFLLVSPQRAHASDLRGQAASQQQANMTLQAQVASLKEQAKQLPQQQAKLAALSSRIPENDPGLPSLIRALTAAADSAGVDLISLSPSTPQPVKAAAVAPSRPVSGSGTSTPAVSAGQLAQIPLTLQVSGGFFQLEQFLSNLEALQRSLLVSGFTAAPGSGPVASGGSAPTAQDSLTASITGRVFMSVTPLAPTTVKPVAPATGQK